LKRAGDVAGEVEGAVLAGGGLRFGDGPLCGGDAAAGEREACPWGTEVTVSKSGRVAMPSSKRRWMAPRWKRVARKPPPERQRAMPRRASGAMGVAGC
jgi:hypothetical protein